MYLAASPFSNIVPMAWATSSPFQASVTFLRLGVSAIFSRASLPTKSWSNFTNGQ